MKTCTTSRLLVASVALFGASACTRGQTEVVQGGDLQFKVSVSPDPPTTGDNHLRLEARDASGKPVDGAKIELSYDMPAMGSMPEMTGGGDVHPEGGGVYDIVYPLAMLGDWTLSVHVQAAGHPPADLRMKVSPPHKGFAVERQGSPAGIAMQPGTPEGSGKWMDVPPERQQLIGVTYGTVEKRPLSLALRAAGRVEVDETQLAEVTLKYEAYVEKMFVSRTGQSVKKGQPLLRLYSPDLLSAEQDLLLAQRSRAAGTPGADALVRASEERLRLWNLTSEQIAQLEAREKAEPRLTVFSPASGAILEKNVVEGSRAMAGTMLYRIGNLGQVWVVADLFEWDAPNLSVGQPATMAVPEVSGETWRGEVSFIYPTIDEKTRSLRARLAFPNGRFLLRPGMYVDVTVEVPLGSRLSIPDSALLISGEHRYAFVQRGPGKLQPVEVEVGALTGEFDEVRSGVAEGAQVATGATFLLSSEAQIRDALPRWSAR